MPDGFAAGASRRRRQKLRGRRTRNAALSGGLVLVVAAMVVSVFVGAVVTASDYIDRLGTLAAYTAHIPGENSIIYARDGSVLSVVASAQNRQPLPLGKISKWLQKATVAIEDRRFYEHAGVDWQAVGRALIADVRSGQASQGGSTITQQLVRSVYLSNDKSVSRKIREMWLALEYEQRYTKAQILDQYLNLIPYGQSAYGAEAAALTYFNRPARSLNLPQAALLAGLPQAPSEYDPFGAPQAAIQRRGQVLQAMLDQGMIDPAAYRWALAAPLGLHRGGSVYGNAQQPYFVNYVLNQLYGDSRYGKKAVDAGGLHIHTTIDPHLQHLAVASMQSILHKPPCPRAPTSNCDPAAAIVTINPRTGEILAMASTASYNRTQFNLAAQGTRQPGSTMKPFTLAAAIEQGMDPSTTTYVSHPFVLDPTSFFGRLYGPWNVHTADGQYSGRITVEQATLQSDNTVYAQLILDTGPQIVLNVARAMGDTTLTPADAVPSLTLGAIGVTPLEQTSAFASFAAYGVYHKPTAIKAIIDPLNRRTVSFASSGQRVMPDGVAAEVTRILGENMTSGTGSLYAHLSDGRPQAGKTGTTSNDVDAWFCGYTPDLVSCVWVGYPVNEHYTMSNVEGFGVVQGPTLPADIWHIYMTQALASYPADNWPPPQTHPTYTKWVSQFTQQAVTITTPTASGTTTTPPAGTGGAPSGGGTTGGAPGGGPTP